MRFLIWQTAYLGDVVLTTPLIRTLQESFPDADITFVGRPFIRNLLGGWEGLRLIPFSKGLLESFRIVKILKGNDVALVPHRSLRTALIIYASRIPVRIGFDRSELPLVFTHRIPHRWDLHEVERNLRLTEPLGRVKLIREPYLPITAEEKETILKRFSLEERSYVVVSPFSNFPLKEWSLDRWAELIRSLGKTVDVVVTGTRRDLEKVRVLKNRARFRDLVGETSLRDLMGVIGGSRGVVSNDSSPVHIANALGVPAVTVYTSTSPDYGFYPVLGGYVRNPAPCSPCSPNPKRCKTGTKECLRSVPADLVLEVCKKVLKV